MADLSQPLIVEALTRAVAIPTGLALYGSKALPGLFACSAAARKAAQQCQDQEFLRVVRTETKGRKSTDICAITDKGLAFLLGQVSLRPVLEALLQALERGAAEVGKLLSAAEQTRTSFESLQATAEKALAQLQQRAGQASVAGETTSGNGAGAWKLAILQHLSGWQQTNALEDCPMPDLLRVARIQSPHLTIGQFHDELRRLSVEGQIYLHPWTGPLYEIPEPTCALLLGHEISYYASLRTAIGFRPSAVGPTSP